MIIIIKIYICGLDGAGKTTQINKLLEYYKARGINITSIWGSYDLRLMKLFVKKKFNKIKEQGNDYHIYYGNIQKQMKNPILRYSYILTYLVDYFIDLRIKIFNINRSNEIVIFDRYLPDAIINLAINTGMNEKRMLKLIKIFQLFFPKYDVGFFFDVSPEESMRRKNDIPGIDYLIYRRDMYLYFVKSEKIEIIDAEKSEKSIHRKLISLLKK